MTGELETIVTALLKQGATDVFLQEEKVPFARLRGAVAQLEDCPPLSSEMMEQFWRDCGADPAEGSDYDKRFELKSLNLFMRVNLYRSMDKLSAAIRPIKNEIPQMENLNLPANVLREWFSRDSGLILVTGASGAGKSTTLASALQDLSQRRQAHVLTIEDPIEYVFTDARSIFSQREVRSDTESFSAALRSSLRQNPDVIFLGEIRDEETAEAALRAAESGHLIVSTLHSSGTVEAIERLVLMFPENLRAGGRHLLSQQLIGIASQLLLPGKTSGLFPVLELLDVSGAVPRWIDEARNAEITDLLARGDHAISRNFQHSLMDAVNRERITEEAALEVSRAPQDLKRLMRGFQ